MQNAAGYSPFLRSVVKTATDGGGGGGGTTARAHETGTHVQQAAGVRDTNSSLSVSRRQHVQVHTLWLTETNVLHRRPGLMVCSPAGVLRASKRPSRSSHKVTSALLRCRTCSSSITMPAAHWSSEGRCRGMASVTYPLAPRTHCLAPRTLTPHAFAPPTCLTYPPHAHTQQSGTTSQHAVLVHVHMPAKSCYLYHLSGVVVGKGP